MKQKILIYKSISFLLLGISIFFFIYGYKQVKTPILISLAFHDVSEDENDVFAIPEDELLSLIKDFLKNDYKSMTPEEFENLPNSNNIRKHLESKKFLMTFDDGKASSVETIKKLYTELGVTSTVFLVLDLIGEPGFMDLASILDLKENYSCNIGLHGKRHKDITEILANNEDLLKEVESAREILSNLTSQEVTWYSYPFGETNASTTEILKATGIKYAFNIEGGDIIGLSDPFFINRIMFTKNAKENHMPNPYSWIKPYTVNNGALTVTLSVLVAFLSLNWYIKSIELKNKIKK